MEEYIEKELDLLEDTITERQKKYGSLIAFSITNKCPLKCKHCIVEANTIETTLTPNDYKTYLDQLANLNQITQISITGGEPFTEPKILQIFSEFCLQNQITLGIVTSAFWAIDKKSAFETVKRYPGISHYAISTDNYHIKYVSLDKIQNAYTSAKLLGKKVLLRISGETMESLSRNDLLINILDIIEDEKDLAFQRLLPLGRAKEHCKDSFVYKSKPSYQPCLSNSPVIKENGAVDPCCGAILTLNGKHPLTLGNTHINSISEIFENINTNWLFNYIRLWGIKDFITAIEKSRFKAKLPKKYLVDDVCTTCCFLFADKEISNFLSKMSESLNFKLKVAIGMDYYLNNSKPLEYLRYTYNI